MKATRILELLTALVAVVVAAPAPAVTARAAAEGPGLFVAGSLADHDGQGFDAKTANATILATDAEKAGIARIDVTVDGKEAASRHLDCKPSCPHAGRLDFTYKRSSFGGGRHEVTIVAATGDGRRARRTIAVLPAPTAKTKGAPNAQPAFYLTARSVGDLRRQAADDAARFARSQGKGTAQLILDFGAARHGGGKWGVALRGGKFFTNDQVQSALQAAARAYHHEYRRGDVEIVYATSNANLGDPGAGYVRMNARDAREAGERQAATLKGLRLYRHESAVVGGDIEPGYDMVAPVNVSIALVAGAAASGRPYYDVGTAPCTGANCTHGWRIGDICKVTTGGTRRILPEIYYVQSIDQPQQWAAVQQRCRIDSFAGVSAAKGAELQPGESWWTLGQRTGAGVGPSIVVFPR